MTGHATGLERGDGMCVVREDWTLGYKVMLVPGDGCDKRDLGMRRVSSSLKSE